MRNRPKGARQMLYPGVWRAGRYVYGAGFVAIAAASELRSPTKLRSDLLAAGL